MKVLITGNKGQLGTDCVKVLSEKHETLCADLPEYNLVDRSVATDLIKGTKPDAIVNCAAYTQVDDAEAHEDLAMAVNADLPAHLAEAAACVGAKLVHISTDYVFPGDKPPPTPYLEEAETGPTSAYGRTKLAGETAVFERTDACAILRTAWLYGAHGANFAKTMLRLALADPERVIKVVNDQFGSPTWSWRLAQQIAALLDQFSPGLYHATSEGYCTWYDFASECLTAMKVPFKLEPCSTAAFPTPARRPENSILENANLKKLGINRMGDWRANIMAFVQEHRTHLLKEQQS